MISEPSASKRWLWRLLQAVGILFAMAVGFEGCVYALYGRFWNIRPGEANYPELNPHPTHIVEVTGIAPPSLDFAFEAEYEALSPAKGCYRAVGMGGSTGFSVIFPVETSHSGDTYKARIVIDKFLPGRCDWQFDAAAPRLADGRKGDSEHLDLSAGVLSRARGEVPPFFKSDGPPINFVRLDIWCGSSPYEENAKSNKSCWDFLAVVPRWQKFLTNPRPDGDRPMSGAAVFDETTSVTLNFYDLDAIVAAQGK